MKIRRLATPIVLLILLLTLGLSAQAQDTKTLNIAFVQDIDAMTYPIYSTQYFSSILTPLWNSPPWVFDESLTPVPRLATEIPSADNGGLSADGKTITIKLRDDIKWSDGEPITADDFVFTYQMYMADANAVASRDPYDKMASVEAPDPQTVVVTFNEPYAPWLTSIYTIVLPKHVLQPVFDADGTLDNADFNRVPTVSSGPFVPTEWQTGNYILFNRNDNYFDGSAQLDQIYVRFVPDDAAQVAALINGDVDMGIFIAPEDAKTLQEKGVGIVTVNSGYNEGLYFNFRPADFSPDMPDHSAIQDLAVRQAIAYGLNRDGIAADLMSYGSGPDDHLVTADTYWHETSWANPDVKHEPFDPDKAKQILEDAGWVDSDGDGIRQKDGKPLKLTWATNQRDVRIQVQAVGKQQLADIGIEVELVNLPSDTFFASYGDAGPVALGQYDFWELSDTTSFPDPNVVKWTCSEISNEDNPSGVNDQGLCDEKLDALFTQETQTADPAARRDLFFQLQQIMHDNVYWLPFWHDPDLWALGARFENARLAGTTQFWNALNWDVSS